MKKKVFSIIFYVASIVFLLYYLFIEMKIYNNFMRDM